MTEVILCLVVVALIVFAAWRERENRLERAQLLQRIQDPERAVVDFAPRPPRRRRRHRPARLVAPDDDEAMARAIKEREEVSDVAGSD